MKVLFERKSTRNFKKVDIDNLTVDYIIKAGMNAPNSGNQRPWEFVVVRDEKVQNSLNGILNYDNNYSNVDVSIVVCINKDRIKWDGYWQMDTGTAVENMMIAATDMGYSTLWLELFPVEEKVKQAQEILSLPSDVIPMMFMPIGEDADEYKAKEVVFLEEQIHLNKWSK